MRKGIVTALVGVLVVTGAGEAEAVTVTMTGAVTSGSGSDGVIHPGDTLSFTATTPDQNLLTVNASGLRGFGTYFDGASLLITLDGYAWKAGADLYDGEDMGVCAVAHPWQCEGGLGVFLSGDQVVTLYGTDLSPASGPTPDLIISSDGSFLITNRNLYENTAAPQRFAGQFDLADAIVTYGVPEPSTWAMMLAGFFGMGAALRRRREVLGLR